MSNIPHAAVLLTARGLHRVPNSQIGMTFVVDKFTNAGSGEVAHVKDYRFMNGDQPQIWSIGEDGYEIVVRF